MSRAFVREQDIEPLEDYRIGSLLRIQTMSQMKA
jgi:hypothetical protein